MAVLAVNFFSTVKSLYLDLFFNCSGMFDTVFVQLDI